MNANKATVAKMQFRAKSLVHWAVQRWFPTLLLPLIVSVAILLSSCPQARPDGTAQRPYAFTVSNNAHLWVNWWDGAAWHWSDQGTPTGGSVPGAVGAVTVMDSPTAAQRPYAFVQSMGGHLWMNWWDGAAWHWSDQGSPTNGNVAAAVGVVTVMDSPTAAQRPYAFVQSNDGHLWVNWWDGAAWHWSDQGTPTGGSVASAVGVVTVMDSPTAAQRPYAFVQSKDGHLWVNWWDGAAWHWSDQGMPTGGSVADAVGVVTVMDSPAAAQRPYAFVESNDGHLWMNWWDGAAWHWSDQGMPTGGRVSGAVGAFTVMNRPAAAQRPYAFVESNDGHLWLNCWDGAAWHWSDQGTPTGGSVAGAVGAFTVMDSPAAAQRPHAFVQGNDGHLWLNWWDGAAWHWSDQGTPTGGSVSRGVGAFTVMDRAPLYGFVDLHTHPMSNLAFGGKLLYGGIDAAPSGGSLLPADPDCNHNVRAKTMEQALGHDKSTHGGMNFLNPYDNPCGDPFRKIVIHKVQQGITGAADEGDDAHGAPDFADWPVWNDVTHQKMWVDWIKRAYDGGLRVMVALAHNSKALGDATAGTGDYATDDKSSGDLQIGEIKSFVERHSDFMEIAYSSADVQRIVNANKLALVLGVELDNFGNLMKPGHVLSPQPGMPTNAEISTEIDRLFAEGVRYIFPIHLIDNAFGATAVYQDLFNYANFYERGQFWNLECADGADQISYTFKPNDDIRYLMAAKFHIFPNQPTYPSCAQVNQGVGVGDGMKLGLTPQGEFAIKEMMRRGMLIDIDHMSQKAANRALELGEAVPNGGYPLNSGHNGVRGFLNANTERNLTSSQYQRLGKLHGMAGAGSADLDAYSWVQAYSAVVNAMGNNAVAGFGTDTNGLVLGMPPSSPRYGQDPKYAACVARREQEYGCTNDLTSAQLATCRASAKAECLRESPPVTTCLKNCGRPLIQYGDSFPRSTLGTRSWDYNVDGVAHYGMIADFLQDVKNVPPEASPGALSGTSVIGNLMLGADYFYQTWKKCELQKANVN